MKAKYVVGIVAVATIGCGVFLAVKSQAKNKNVEKEQTNPSASMVEKNDTKSDFQAEAEKSACTRAYVQESIERRHKEAAKVMDESLKNIVREPVQTPVSEGEEVFEEMDRALDKLLDD